MTDRFPIRKIDHLRFYCGNALHAAEWYKNKFGFDIIGYSGLETGSKNEASYLLQQGDVRFLMTSSLRPDDPIGALVGKHGDFVRDVCFEVDNVEESFKNAVASGAEPVNEPLFIEDSFGKVHLASIKTYGDVIHTFLNRDSFSGLFLPNFVPMDKKGQGIGLQFVDHVVGNVELGGMNYWAQWYAKVLNFEQLVHFDDKDISTEYTALMSKVMQSGNGRVKFPINEPAEGKKKSQIDEYLEFHGGAGVQHIAIHTEDIIKTISELRKREIEFLAVPRTYYDTVTERVGEIQEPLDTIADLGILVDRDDEGYLLQLFTKPVEPRPTLFFEIIQRRGAKSFGKGNFKALFEAIEREQQLRGTL